MRLLTILTALVASIFTPLARGGDVCDSATNGCLVVNLDAAGCDDSACCNTVCVLEPTCCELAWDQLCVALAFKFCDSCGVAGNSCFSAGAAPGCSQANCCNYVCSLPGWEFCCEIVWDAACAKAADFYCQGCGSPGAGNCNSVHEGFGCVDAVCCGSVCAVDPDCCTLSWDQTCVEWANIFCPGCGSPLVGACCWPHAGPYCDDAACCETVCAADPFCCSTTWDNVCVLVANASCNLTLCNCGDPSAGLCKTVHATPGCSDFECCTAVCSADSYCCAAEWDFACTLLTLEFCDSLATCGDLGKGSCFVKHDTPGCDDGGCCERVCDIDPLCCEIAWDLDCVFFADSVCTDCGDLSTGSCFVPHGSPACSDKECCEGVCAGDPFCCQDSWDTVCAFLASAICPDPLQNCGTNVSRNCYLPSSLPGCDNASCCNEICTSIDPFCCEGAWDEVCVDMALSYCGDFGAACPGRGSCITEHVFPGCNDAICCTAICLLDPTCCTLGWDASCAESAKSLCFGLIVCPGDKPCDKTHGSPGCEDPSCCNVVCAIDPLCCQERWDVLCVQLAQTRCQPLPSQPCPCIGSCFQSHDNAGCDDASCCAGVCVVDVSCCDTLWDDVCVGLARGLCCGTVGCGNACAGSCYAISDAPYCDNAACCEAICAEDPVCCSQRWDSACVGAAEDRCIRLCGVFGSGGCFTAKTTPACDIRSCCDAVCNVDPFCCESTWDGDCATLAKGDDLAQPPVTGLCAVPDCGENAAGRCCEEHDTPACDDNACCNSVCDTDPFCCDSTWDATCVELARKDNACNCVSDCGDSCAGSCCAAHDGPLCDDEQCCLAVCLIDPFCCDLGGGVWDNLCAALAFSTAACFDSCPPPECGDPEAGDCCLPHVLPNCADKECCNDVCDVDSFCCDVQWDLSCALQAAKLCDICTAKLFCGSPNAGSCFVAHSDPYCDDAGCCNLVCTIDESCCTTEWDVLCAEFAAQFCGG
ncbi:MAG: hypothetical protein JNM94_15015 [Phycisphaerae bacterium]|nr:hypothetical protein [Phycisphaerae bacterium]